MGRGSGGGASHSGGGHTGGHSFGGRGSSGRNSSNNRSFTNKNRMRRNITSGNIFINNSYYTGESQYGGYRPRPPRRSQNRGGCLSSMILMLIVLMFVFMTFASASKSDKERLAITGTKTSKIWYEDALNYIENDSDLTDGLQYFYGKTGIQPLVLFMDYDSTFWTNGSWDENAADEYLSREYEKRFNDQGHMILAYFACENDSRNLDGTFYLYYGSKAFSVMDQEAERVFWSYFDTNYDNLDYSISEFIGKSFTQTANNIMHIEKGNSEKDMLIIIFASVVVIFIVTAIVLTKVLRKGKDE